MTSGEPNSSARPTEANIGVGTQHVERVPHRPRANNQDVAPCHLCLPSPSAIGGVGENILSKLPLRAVAEEGSFGGVVARLSYVRHWPHAERSNQPKHQEDQ